MKNIKKVDKGKNFIHIQLYQITINLTSEIKEHKEPFGKRNCTKIVNIQFYT